MLREAGGIAAHDRGIHAELGLCEFGAGCHLGGELVGLPAGGRVDRRVGGAEEEMRGAGNLASGRKLALVAQVPRRCRQRGRVDIEHRLGVGLIAGLRIISGQAQQVVDAASRRAHEVGLQGNAVAIPAGELKDGFDALARQHRRRDRR